MKVHDIAASAGSSGPDAPPEAATIRQQLERLLVSPHFRNSKRSQALLKYVVEAYLDGAVEKVKERVIGVEVFGREADYDTNQDSVVRTSAAEVRKRLAQYYLEAGHGTELRVGLPQGSYIPEFHQPQPAGTLDPVRARPRRLWRLLAVLGVAVSAVLGAWAVFGLRLSAMDRFWAPILDDRAPAVICIEQPLRIYRFVGSRGDELNQKMVGLPPAPPPPASVRENTTIKLSDLVPSGERYFSYGDLMASGRLVELMVRKGKPVEILGDRLTTYHDLRGRPAILLGQFNNKWTVGLTSGLRYYLYKSIPNRRYEVHDRRDPAKVLYSVSLGDRPEEYAIVSRVFDVSTEKTVIAVTATSTYGTLAAGDFLTHEAYIEEAFRQAPPDWWKKNLQVVLRSKMVAGAPGPPKAILTFFW